MRSSVCQSIDRLHSYIPGCIYALKDNRQPGELLLVLVVHISTPFSVGVCRAVVGRSRKILPLMTLMARPLSRRAVRAGRAGRSSTLCDMPFWVASFLPYPLWLQPGFGVGLFRAARVLALKGLHGW